MKIITLPVSDIHPADYNPRKDLAPGDKQYDKLARSIETFGYVEPIVWNRTTGNIVGGHQRLKVLVQKGYTEVQVVEVELNEQEEHILNVSLNKISGRWDNEKLTAILDELKEQDEMALTGFEDWELDALKVTYDHIEDLLNEDFSDTGKSEPNSYTMTFTLPEEVHEAMDKYIDENPAGKVELAQLQYTLPRIMGKGLALSRLGGGIGTRGPGETKLEVDRRRIRDRIAYIKECIGKVKSVRTLHRAGRAKASVPTVSLVGYTNAGKSTLLNTLTNSDIYAQDQLFATLDPTTRQLDLPNKQQAILTDTVGFIQRLPHQLVAAFQSTLEEVVQSDVLLHVIDVSHELYKEQAAAVYQVLDELGAKDKTIITVYNKIDKLPPDSGLAERLSKEENSICISAKGRLNLDGLLALIAENLKLKAVEESFLVPYSDSAAVGRLHDAGTVLEQEYLAEGTLLKVRLDAEQVQQFAKYLAADAKA